MLSYPPVVSCLSCSHFRSRCNVSRAVTYSRVWHVHRGNLEEMRCFRVSFLASARRPRAPPSRGLSVQLTARCSTRSAAPQNTHLDWNTRGCEASSFGLLTAATSQPDSQVRPDQEFSSICLHPPGALVSATRSVLRPPLLARPPFPPFSAQRECRALPVWSASSLKAPQKC